jgi:virginiamycin A acetyltransferase
MRNLMVSIFNKLLSFSKQRNYYSDNKLVNVHNTAFVQGCNVVGKLEIGAASKVTDALISGAISIGSNSKVVGGVAMKGDISIGNYSSLNGPNLDITAKVNKVNIGNFCSVARNVSIQEYDHNFYNLSTYHISQNVFGKDVLNDINSKGDVIIKNDVWIGTQCVILSGVTIGNGVVVAANSVVTKDIPDFAVVAGSPAKVLKYRFSPEIIEKLNELKWWDWDNEKLKANEGVFSNELTMEKLNNLK